jgi:hypothetical protein
MIPLVLALICSIYSNEIYIVKTFKCFKLLFLNTYNGSGKNAIFIIILQEKYFFEGEGIIIFNSHLWMKNVKEYLIGFSKTCKII